MLLNGISSANVFSCFIHRFVLYLEAAANGMFGTGHNGLINPPDPKKCYSVTRVEIAVFEEVVNELLLDLAVLFGMSKVRLTFGHAYKDTHKFW